MKTAFFFIIPFSIYLAAFSWLGGNENISPDGKMYLQAINGEKVVKPYSGRWLIPKMAGITNNPIAVFHILTPLCLFLSLILLVPMLQNENASSVFIYACVAGFGAQMAAIYGHAPILIDTPLLLLSTVTCLALQRKWLVTALICTCLAVCVKEYGVLLVAPVGVAMWQINKRLLPLLFFPLALLVAAYFIIDSSPSDVIWLFTYYPNLFIRIGGLLFLKTIYYQIWGAMVPVIILAAVVIWTERKSLSYTHYFCLFALLTFPILLLGDIDRTLPLLFPYASLMAARGKEKLGIPLLIGGVVVAVARLELPGKTLLAGVGILALLIFSAQVLSKWKNQDLLKSQAVH